MTLPAWRTVKVFISSTFRDMHAERDHLVRVVFPALRERLYKHSVYLDEIDLRWGISREQSENEQTLDLCLKTIEECRPYFLGLVGDRYGTVLGAIRGASVGGSADDVSVTEREILHGAIQSDVHARAIFFLRDSAALEQIPMALRQSIYSETDPATQQRLINLKGRIFASGYATYIYPATWDPTSSDRINHVTGRFVGLEKFGADVETALWDAIAKELNLTGTAEQPAMDALHRENLLHEQFKQSATRVFAGRQNILTKLLDYVYSQETSICLVMGPSGSGKSSVLARLALTIDQEPDAATTITHFATASETSGSLHGMLTRLFSETARVVDETRERRRRAVEAQYEREKERLERIASEPRPPREVDALRERLTNEYKLKVGSIDAAISVPTDLRTLRTRFVELLDKWPSDCPVVLLIDAIDQIDTDGGRLLLDWLPRSLKPNVKVIISCIDNKDQGRELLAALRLRKHIAVNLPRLTEDERVEIIRAVPSLSAKTLNSRHVRLLLANAATFNPLFLRIALEELRALGSRQELTKRIGTLPGGRETIFRWLWRVLRLKKAPILYELVQALFAQILERLENEFGVEIVRTILAMLAVSRRGLLESELAGLVRNIAGEANLFVILRQLRPYLANREGLLSLYHLQLEVAVYNRYLRETEELPDVDRAFTERIRKHYPNQPEKIELLRGSATRKGKVHFQLASYFTEQPWQVLHEDALQPNARKCDELPWQMLHFGGSGSVLKDPEFLETKAACGRLADLADDFRRERIRSYEFGVAADRLLIPKYGPSGFRSHREPEHVLRLRHIEEAIRNNLEFVSGRPDSLFQVLWNALWWHDRPEHLAHCDRTVDPNLTSKYAHNPEMLEAFERAINRAPDSLGLSDWLERWRVSRIERGLRTPWLRYLRPPSRPLRLPGRFIFHGGAVAQVLPVRRRRMFATVGENDVRVWNADTGDELHSLQIADVKSSGDVWRVSLNLEFDDDWGWDEAEPASAPTGTVSEFFADLRRRDPNLRNVFFDPGKDIGCVACAAAGGLIAVGVDNELRLYEVTSGEISKSFNLPQSVVSADFSRDGKLIAACDRSTTILVWNVETGQVAHRLVGPREYRRVQFYANHQALIGSEGADDPLVPSDHWNLATGTIMATLPGSWFGFSLDGKCVLWAVPGREIEGGGSNALVMEVLKNATTSAPLTYPTNIQLPAGRIAFSVDGKQIAVAVADDSNGLVELHSIAGDGVMRLRLGHRVSSLTYVDTFDQPTFDDMLLNRESDFIGDDLRQRRYGDTPEWVGEPLLVTASSDGSVALVPVNRGGPAPLWPIRHEAAIDHLEFTGDGRYLVSLGRDALRLWQGESGLPLGRWEPRGTVASCSPDSSYVAVATHDGTVGFWSLPDGVLLRSRTTGVLSCLAHSPDGTMVLGGDDRGRVTIWTAADMQEVMTIEGPNAKGRNAAVTSVAIQENHSLVAICTDETDVRLVDLKTSQEAGSIPRQPPEGSGAQAMSAHSAEFAGDEDSPLVLTLDRLRAETNIWHLDGRHFGKIPGLSDLKALALQYPRWALFYPSLAELCVLDVTNQAPHAYIPSKAIRRIATHPGQRIFAAAEDRDLLMFALERDESARPH